MQEKITAYLKERYAPLSIILHGSRAVGKERTHSDWDFILLYNHKNNPGSFREYVEGENIEVFSVTLPVKNVIDTFDTKLQYAVVLTETRGEASDLLKKAQEVYARGFLWPPTWPNGPKLWMEGRIVGMRDTVANPEKFLRHLSLFYPRALNYWYQVLHQEYSKPIYFALSDIKTRDPKYRALLKELADSSMSYEGKTIVAEKIKEHLFEMKQ